MRVMYKPQPDRFPDWVIPKLHPGIAPAAADYDEIRVWCDENCREAYYTYPSWTNKKGAEFEDDEDAREFVVWSSLRWG